VVDISAIAGLASSFRSIVEITKAMKDVNDANVIQTKVFELTREIMSAQACALAAQVVQSDLLQRERQFEAEIAKLKTWDAEKQRYRLERFPPGIFVYALKPEMARGEPAHQICEKCYQNDKKSILHSLGNDGGVETFRCHGCGTDFSVGAGQGSHRSDYNPFCNDDGTPRL
jgi:hypothetical protein